LNEQLKEAQAMLQSSQALYTPVYNEEGVIYEEPERQTKFSNQDDEQFW